VEQKFTMDTAYYIIRELMNTERTYKKDLEVIAVVSLYVLYFYKCCHILVHDLLGILTRIFFICHQLDQGRLNVDIKIRFWPVLKKMDSMHRLGTSEVIEKENQECNLETIATTNSTNFSIGLIYSGVKSMLGRSPKVNILLVM